MFSSPLTIIDCGASRVAAGIVGRAGGRLRLEDFGVERLRTSVGGDEPWPRQTGDALQALRARIEPRGRVVLVLPPHLTLTKSIVTPRVSAAKRAKIVRFEAAQALPCNLADVSWGAVKCGETGGGCENWLAAARLAAARALAEAASVAGFEPDEMLPSPLATLGAARLTLAGRGGPALVLNLGARSATMLLIEGVRFATRTVALGAQTTPTEAYGARLAQEVTRTLLHFGRRDAAAKPEMIWLTGGAARQAGLEAVLAERLALPVKKLDPLAAIDPGRVIASAGLVEAPSGWHDVIGAAAAWHDPSVGALNLLPVALRRRAWLRRRQAWLMAAAALAVAALLPPALHYRSLERAARSKAAAIEQSLVPVRERAARLRAAQAELAELRRAADVLQRVQERRSAWPGFLADLQARLVQVEDVWLERLETVPPAGDVPLKVSVSGRMLDRTNPLAKVSPETLHRVRTLLAGLVDSPFIAAVEGERFDNSQPGLLRFDFVLVTEPAHPL